MTSASQQGRLDAAMQVGLGPPVHWPSLSAVQLEHECVEFWSWVRHVRGRFPHALRLPECWWLHNDLVELLLALRDYERYAFSGVAGAAGAVSWHGALRDIEARLESWTRRLRCHLPGKGHGDSSAGQSASAADFLSAELARRGFPGPARVG